MRPKWCVRRRAGAGTRVGEGEGVAPCSAGAGGHAPRGRAPRVRPRRAKREKAAGPAAAARACGAVAACGGARDVAAAAGGTRKTCASNPAAAGATAWPRACDCLLPFFSFWCRGNNRARARAASRAGARAGEPGAPAAAERALSGSEIPRRAMRPAPLRPGAEPPRGTAAAGRAPRARARVWPFGLPCFSAMRVRPNRG